MNDLHKFMSEWGLILSAIICLTYGFFYGWIYCAGTPTQKIVAYLVFVILIVAGLAMLDIERTPGETMSRGVLAQRILFGAPLPLMAGIGVFALCNPEKWFAVAEQRKYQKQLKGES